jgi:carboxypeptidase C (cathepsin A)
MPDETGEEPAKPAPTPPSPVDDIVSTRHELATGTGALAYTASAGRVVLREEVYEDGVFRGLKPKAEVFLVSYVAHPGDGGPRPVTFAFNGGPGSSSVWLHFGLLGPRRVVMGDVGALAPPPYGLADNAETLLAHSDLVFIDPVSTGYSRVVEGDKVADFHGYQRDLESVGAVIRLWTSRNGRWLSPKYLIGESYGTLRAAALADHLQARYGIALNGLMLVSTVLDLGTLDDKADGNDIAFVLSLPTFACLAHYHGLLGDRPLEEVRAQAEAFAIGDYARALLVGNRLPDDERRAVVSQLAGLTGLRPEWVERANLRIASHRFFRELLRDRGLVIGRLDGRFTGWEADAAGERATVDPSYSAILGPYAAACNHYLSAELEYKNDLPYEVLTDRVRPWSFKEFEGRQVSVAERLAAAMRGNSHLRVQIAAGYYDGATPYFAAEHAVQHLHLPDELRANISFRYYGAGHMMYVHEESRRRQSEDLAAFVT